MHNVFSTRVEFNKPIFWHEMGRWMMQNGSSTILAMWQLNGYDDLLLKYSELCKTFRHTNLHFFRTSLLLQKRLFHTQAHFSQNYFDLTLVTSTCILQLFVFWILMGLYYGFNEAFNRKEDLKCNCFENLHLVLLTLKS